MRLRLPGILAFALALAGCVSHPTAPPTNGQATDHVTISGPKTAFLGDSVPYSATVDFVPQSTLMYDWKIDSSNLQILSNSQVVHQSFAFHSVGDHVLQVRVLRSSDSALLCAGSDTTTVLQVQIQIIPDSAITLLGLPNGYHIRVLRGKVPSSATVRWTLDTSTFVTSYATDSGKIVYRFPIPGARTIAASVLDSANQVIASTSIILNVAPLNTSILASFHTIEVVFAGTHSFSGCSGSGLPGYHGSAFIDTLRNVVIAGVRIDTFGSISNDGQTLDSLSFSLGGSDDSSGYWRCQCNGYECFSERRVWTSGSMRITSLQLNSIDADSLVFGLSGLVCQKHIGLEDASGISFRGDPSCCSECSGYSAITCSYQSTDWPTAAIRVTFRK